MPTHRTPVKSATRRMEPAEAVPAPPAQSNQRLSAAASLVPLQQGLYALTIDPSALTEEEFSGVRVPIVQISVPPDTQGRCVEIIGAGPHQGWLRCDGGTVILRSPPGGGHALVSAYSLPGQSVQLPPIEVQRLDRLRGSNKPPAVTVPTDEPIEVRTEIVLHMERLGDRRFSGEGWIGNRSKRLRIEAFSIRPVDSMTPRDIEFMALGPNRRQTPWVTDAKLCGTRGRGMPLTGFAIRVAGHVCDQFDIVYQGAFFDSGIVGPCRNGELCIPPVSDDPLEAIHVRLMRRCGERGRDPV